MVLSVTISFISAVTAVNQSKRDVRQALDGFVTHKSIEIYNGVKNYSEFAETLIKEKKVAVVPGEAFGESGKYFIRCSYAYSMKNLIAAVERIKEFVGEHIVK